MAFDFNISTLSIALYAAALVALIYICSIYLHRLSLIWRRKRQCDAAEAPDPTKLPTVSIIIYAQSESEALGRNLPLMLEQDYPAGFEIIVVNEGSSAETDMVVSALRIVHPNIYLTYTPDGARNLSRKKLALTIGIKAAKGDVVLISDAMTHVDSPLWLQKMAKGFLNPETKVVIGYGAPAIPASRFAGRLISAFDIVADSAPWLAAAIAHHPYRGCGYNLAYRRQLFFENKGFSRSLNLRRGDDDIFVHEIADGDNTTVQIAADAQVKQELMPFKRALKDDRISHAFTGRRLPHGSRILMNVGDWCLWVAIACAIGGGVAAGLLNPVGWIATAVIAIGAIVAYTILWSKTIKALQGYKLVWSLPFIAIMRPWRKALFSMRSRITKGGHYTWQ